MPTPDTISPDIPETDIIVPDTTAPNPAVPDVVPESVPDEVEPRNPLRQPLICPDSQAELEPRYNVLIHNDEVTTFEYVIYILNSLFLLSDELAEHIAWTAHNKGTAIVVVRPRSEAETLAKAASNRARIDGFPLTFSVEEQE